MIVVLFGLKTGAVAQSSSLGQCDDWGVQGGSSQSLVCWCYTPECEEWLYGAGNWDSAAYSFAFDVCNSEYCGGPWDFETDIFSATGSANFECEPRCMPDGGCGC